MAHYLEGLRGLSKAATDYFYMAGICMFESSGNIYFHQSLVIIETRKWHVCLYIPTNIGDLHEFGIKRIGSFWWSCPPKEYMDTDL